MDDWSSINPNMNGGTEPPKKDEQNKQDVAPVNLSKKKVGVLLVIVLAIAIVLIVVIQSCSIQREVNVPSPTPTPEITISDTGNSVGNTGEEEPEFSENMVENEGSASGRDEEANSASNSVVDSGESNVVDEEVEPTVDPTEEPVAGEPATEKGSGLQEVAEPVLGELQQTTAMVSSKKVYNINDSSYAYAISLVLLTGENQTTSVEYFCPRKTYDALSTADSVTVQYQVDSNGIISVASVSK